jgi:site-specific DNA-methyltransferase (cytosine-N4-specific)
MTQWNEQLDLFHHVAGAYASSRETTLSNESLYTTVANTAGIPDHILNARQPVGKSGIPRSPLKRRIRWVQQTLKSLGLLERATGKRAEWHLTEAGRNRLTPAPPKAVLLAFSTDLGVALWARNESVFPNLNEPIALCFTSPPYLLRRPKAYGNPRQEREYIDFLCQSLEPIIRNLIPGGSLCLNISNDVFVPGSPARSLYCERLVLALCDEFGLHLMDRVIWVNNSKPPGPVHWASVHRYQLNTAYEPIYWFTNDPSRVRSDNRRVLQPHTDRQLCLMAKGGENRHQTSSDGAHRVRPGDYGKATPGRIPRNVMVRGHQSSDLTKYRKLARAAELPLHAAAQCQDIARFFVEFLTEVDDLVAEPFGGTLSTARAAEATGRRWIATELMREYIEGASLLFRDCAGYMRG